MKNLKLILFLFISASLLSCGDDNNTPAFPLSNVNIAGNYDISNLVVSTDITTTLNGVPLKIGTATTTGDLFKVDVVMNADGTYNVEGSYTVIARLAPVVGNPVETRDIIDIENSGTFTLNTTNNTITFSEGLVRDLTGTLEVQLFNETSFSLFQEVDVTVGSNTESISTNIAFSRK
jgi:hypothetical protein